MAFLSPGVAAQIDDNGNGMSDVYERAYGVSNPTADPDGDGQNNLAECIAGTDPVQAASVFAASGFQLLEGNVARISWPTVAGKRYQVQVATTLGLWQDVAGAVTGDGAEKTLDLPLGTTFLTGKMQDSRWTLAPNEGLTKVKANAANNVAPTVLTSLTSLEIPATKPDENYFGHWVRGWIVPPATGSYQFWIASDDGSELWLSTNATTAARVKIASVSGFTSYQQWDKFPSQVSAPVSLVADTPYYFEAFQAEGTGGDHLSVAWTGPGIPSKVPLAGRYVASSPQSLAESQAGRASLFFRVAVSDVDSDGDGVSDADELLIGYNPALKTTVPRVDDLGAIRAGLAASNVVTLGSPQARAYETPLSAGRFTFFRSGSFGPLTIQYTVGGTATSGADYAGLPGTITLPAGKTSVSVDIVPNFDGTVEPAETVIAQVVAGPGYTVGSPASATVTIDDAQDILYVANLRPDASALSGGNGTASLGYGTASLNVAGNRVFGKVGVSLGNLTAPQLRTELYISPNGASGTAVLTLPSGQIGGTRWDFPPAGGYSQAEILGALAEGRLYARVISSAYANGEILGQFVASQGWQTMPVPPTPPTVSTTGPTPMEAARFLTQATFGPTRASINNLVSVGSYETWLAQQFAITPGSLHLPYVQARRAEFRARNPDDDGWQRPLQEAWWENALRAPDQLRQRMAFALSQIFVVSQVGALDASHEGVANYYDLLVTHAFGNFRTLLKDVTLSPMMGTYLSMIRNQKPNPATGSEPDENYAREVMQLFTIGLSQLHPDGSLKLDANGLPQPTYTQADIVGLAHVFTGWSYPPVGDKPSFLYGPRDEIRPMEAYENYHDTAQKRIVGNTLIPAGQTTQQDLDQAIDTLFNHPNVGPFIARHLIQKFVSSNPSPGYIYRVATVFNNNGSGVRGDLQATLRAVLLDYEARSSNLLTYQAFGKLREPILRVAHELRAINILPPLPTDNRLFIDLQYDLPIQAPLQSPSVFNFFQPGYIPPGPLSAAGVFAPEFQVTSETTAISQLNSHRSTLFWGIYSPEPLAPDTSSKAYFDYAALLTILNRSGFTAVQNQQALLDELNLILLNGRMTAGLRTQITTAFAELPSWFATTNPDYQKFRVRMAVYLILASPEYVIQK